MNNVTKTITGIAFAMIANGAMAGSLGDDSSDTSTVTLEVTDKVQVSSISDISLGAYNGTDANMNGGTSYCVFRNGGDNYRLKLTTDQAGGFEVKSATTSDTIDFTAKIDTDTDASDGTAILHGAWSANMAGSNQTNCGGSDNCALYVEFAQADLLAVSSGNDYQAVITVFVEPI